MFTFLRPSTWIQLYFNVLSGNRMLVIVRKSKPETFVCPQLQQTNRKHLRTSNSNATNYRGMNAWGMVESSIVPPSPSQPTSIWRKPPQTSETHTGCCQNKTEEKLIGGCYELLGLFKQQKLSTGTPPLSCFALDNNINAGLVAAPGGIAKMGRLAAWFLHETVIRASPRRSFAVWFRLPYCACALSLSDHRHSGLSLIGR